MYTPGFCAISLSNVDLALFASSVVIAGEMVLSCTSTVFGSCAPRDCTTRTASLAVSVGSAP